MIRKHFLIALLGFTCFPILAQHITYFNYLNYTSKWEYYMSYIGINGVHGFVEFIYFIEGDTLIGNQWNYKVRQIRRQTQVSPDYSVGTVTNHYVYALRETPDSLFVYHFPDGSIESFSQLPGGWNASTLNVEGQIPHRIYWWGQSPIRGWIEGIGYGQEGGKFPYQPGNKYFKCYTRDSLSTGLLGDTCIIEDLLSTAVTPINEFKISLYPNPARDFVIITGADQIQGTVTLIIYTPDGKQALYYEGAGVDPIDIHSLSDGIYFVSISFDKNRFTTKLMVNR